MSGHHFWTAKIRESAALNPIDRITEVLFGLIMILTITGSIRVAHAGMQDAKDMLWSAMSCNLAWGIVDAAMFLMNVVLTRSKSVTVIADIRAALDEKKVREIVRNEIPPVLLSFMSDNELDNIISHVKQAPPVPQKLLLTGSDLFSALQIFILVFLSGIPVTLPFLFVNDVMLAVRISNGLALVMLMIGGYRLAKFSGLRPLLTGIAYAGIGVALVVLTEVLGG